MIPTWVSAAIAVLGAVGTLIVVAYSVGSLKGVITTRIDVLDVWMKERHEENGRRMAAIEHRLAGVEARLPTKR